MNDKDIVSFDLFDTLLIRRIHNPDLVKLPVARFIAELAGLKGISWKWQRIQKQRDSIEQRHREETGKKFVDHEACYPLFMRELLMDIFQDEFRQEILDKVTEYELAMENSMLVPRRVLVDWLRELRLAGKRLIIISDVYLPADHLWQLVKHAGIHDLIEEVVSSADTFMAKASGKAYPLVAEKFSFSPGRWLHIGDNPISDGLRAEEFGIEAMLICDPREEQRKSIVKRYYNYSDGRPFWRGRVLQQLMAPLEAENQINQYCILKDTISSDR